MRRPRLTARELDAILVALARCLAGEPETDDEDTDGMERAARKVGAIMGRRKNSANDDKHN